MNYTHLGRTGLKVSRLCLGTMNFGDVTDEKTSARILDEALEAGINFIDTADVYGTEQSPDIQQGSGLSEEIIGRWLQQGGRRERIVLATKVYQPMGPGPNDRRLSAYHIRKACEDSLRRLKTDPERDCNVFSALSISSSSRDRWDFFSVGFLRRREGPSPAGRACDRLLSRLSCTSLINSSVRPRRLLSTIAPWSIS